jgi:hypothetical protein
MSAVRVSKWAWESLRERLDHIHTQSQARQRWLEEFRSTSLRMPRLRGLRATQAIRPF